MLRALQQGLTPDVEMEIVGLGDLPLYNEEMVLVVAQGPRPACERLLEALRGAGTPGTVDNVIADFSAPGEPMSGFRER